MAERRRPTARTIAVSVIGVLGGACVAGGVIVGVRENEAAALLASGVLLLFLALVGDEWENLKLKLPGGAEGEVTRRAEATQAIFQLQGQVADVAAALGQSDAPEELKQQTAELVAATEQAAANVANVLMNDDWVFPTSMFGHTGAKLSFFAVKPVSGRLLCRVTTPEGQAYETAPGRLETGTYVALFPHDFPDAPYTLAPGRYDVQWIRVIAGVHTVIASAPFINGITVEVRRRDE